MILLKAVHFVLSCGLFFVFWLLFRFGKLQFGGYGYRYNYFVTALYASLLFFFNRSYNSYLFGYSRIRSLIFSQFISQLFALVLIYLITAIAWKQWFATKVTCIMGIARQQMRSSFSPTASVSASRIKMPTIIPGKSSNSTMQANAPGQHSWEAHRAPLPN